MNAGAVGASPGAMTARTLVMQAGPERGFVCFKRLQVLALALSQVTLICGAVDLGHVAAYWSD